MIITIEEGRKKLGKFGENKTDEEIQQVINTLRTLANITIDTVLEMALKIKNLEEYRVKPKQV